MTQISKWLKDCTDNHKDALGCPPNLDVPFPTRVLEVSPSGQEVDSVRLVETSGKSGAYACLSHCWGLKPLIRTLKGNYEQHKAGILFDNLPQTFQDAVNITRSLGIPYVWIDSLCIIQDDGEDWLKEAALMARIYQNGRLTITASNSTGSDGGCFADSSRFLSKELSIVDADGEEHFARARLRIDHGKWPILQRGWVYQERTLSPRVLHFGHAEVIWECFESLACECSRAKNSEFQVFDFMVGKKKLLDQWTISPEYCPHALNMKRDWSVDIWREMVESYTRLNLTYAKDIFPALSGSAKQLQRHRGSRYIAGMWEDTLVEDLLWESCELWAPRSPEWNSPTWSWAAVSGGVYNDRGLGTGARYDEFRYLNNIEHRYVTVDEASVTPLGPDPTAQIIAAHLILTGPALSATMRREFGEYSVGNLIITDFEFEDEEEPPTSNFKPDYCLSAEGKGFVPVGAEVLLLKMVNAAEESRSESPPRSCVFYLVLCRVDEPEPTYERIGITYYDLSLASRFEARGLENIMTIRIV